VHSEPSSSSEGSGPSLCTRGSVCCHSEYVSHQVPYVCTVSHVPVVKGAGRLSVPEVLSAVTPNTCLIRYMCTVSYVPVVKGAGRLSVPEVLSAVTPNTCLIRLCAQ
jgi:hypothetical protein